MEIVKIIVIAIILIGISMLGLALKMIFKKNGSFPQHSIGRNKKMKELGINCVRAEEIKCHKKTNDPDICNSCTEI